MECKFDNGVILICFYNNFENFVKYWMDHYIKLGIKNYVMINNNSTDKSTDIIRSFEKTVNISYWETNSRYNCNRMCGLKQQIMEFYGRNKMYLTVDSDELFVYSDYEHISIDNFTKHNKLLYYKSLIVDVYPKNNVLNSKIEDFLFIDKSTYKKGTKVPYYERYFGGPRERIFNIKPSLQKIPLIYYTGKEIYINDHFYYPWKINKAANLNSILLHYKFLPGDIKKYHEFAIDGRHWNNSSEYKIYDNYVQNNKQLIFYDNKISVPIKEIFKIIK